MSNAINTAWINDELAVVRARLLDADSFVRSGGSDGTSLTNEGRRDLEARHDQLCRMLDRLQRPRSMFRRGVVRGLGGY